MRTSSRTLLATVALSALTVATAKAQDSLEATVGTDIVSSYIWRGMKLGDFSFQPSAGVAYKGLSLSAWGSVGSQGPTEDGKNLNEVDFTLGYSITEALSVAVTDYWCAGNEDVYFKYEAHSTIHVFEGTLSYDFGKFSLAWNTNFAGADYFKENGDRAYSTYIEAAVPFKVQDVDFSLAVGGTPWEGAYHDDAALTNITLSAAKEIKVTESFALPLKAAITANPADEAMYFVVGLSF